MVSCPPWAEGRGGSCFPKDVKALVAAGTKKGYVPKILKATLAVNETQPLQGVQLAQAAVRSLKGKRVAILGLSFKGGFDDVRESRAIPLAKALLKKGAKAVGFDPIGADASHREVPKVEIAKDLRSALAHADVWFVHNDGPEERGLATADFSGMRRKTVIDGRRILKRRAMHGVDLICSADDRRRREGPSERRLSRC